MNLTVLLLSKKNNVLLFMKYDYPGGTTNDQKKNKI